MPFDKDAAAKYAIEHAEPHSTGYCARYVRLAIDAGGVVLTAVPYAREYGQNLNDVGFSLIETTTPGSNPVDYDPAVGDVVVIQPCSTPETADGHVEIFTPRGFVSDFIQLDPFWPNIDPASVWQREKPTATIWRFLDDDEPEDQPSADPFEGFSLT